VTPLYPQKLALTSPTGGGRSVGIVRSRTKATEFSLVLNINRRSDLQEVLEIVHRCDDCISATYGWTSVYSHLMCLDNSKVTTGLPADGDDYRRNAQEC